MQIGDPGQDQRLGRKLVLCPNQRHGDRVVELRRAESGTSPQIVRPHITKAGPAGKVRVVCDEMNIVPNPRPAQMQAERDPEQHDKPNEM